MEWISEAGVLIPMALVAILIVVVARARFGTPRVAPMTREQLQAGTPLHWNCHLRRTGHLDALAGFGVLVLDRGIVSFRPDDDPGQGWSVPANAVTISMASPLGGFDLQLSSAQLGTVMVTVGHERINRFSRNDLKDIRQRRTAAEVREALRAAGAQAA